MPFKKSKRKPVRIETEESQAWSSPKKARRLSKSNQIARDHANEVHDLKERMAYLEAANAALDKTYLSLVFCIPTEADIAALEVITNMPVHVAIGAYVLDSVKHLNSFRKRCETAKRQFTEHCYVKAQMADRAIMAEGRK